MNAIPSAASLSPIASGNVLSGRFCMSKAVPAICPRLHPMPETIRTLTARVTKADGLVVSESSVPAEREAKSSSAETMTIVSGLKRRSSKRGYQQKRGGNAD